MQFLLDHLVAVAVGAVLVFILAVLGMRQQEESVSLAEHHLSAGREAALWNWLQGDLQSVTAVTLKTDTRLVFTRSSDPAAGLTTQVEYEVACEVSAPTRCKVVRREAGVTRTVSPLVSTFRVTLLSASGQPTAVPSQTVALRVRVATAPAVSGGAAPVWERTFTPGMLGRTTL